MHAKVLDVLYLEEPIYSREYLVRALQIVIDDYSISNAIYIVTQDNPLSNNLLMYIYI